MRRPYALAAAAALALAACRHGPPPVRPPPTGRDEASAREVLRRFASAVEARRWPEAFALLSERWRGTYTPARLGGDADGAGPVARDAAARVLAVLDAGAPLVGEGPRRTLAVGAGRAAALVLEDGGWRVDALE